MIRLLKILALTARFRLDVLLLNLPLPRPLSWALRLSPLRLLPAREPRAVRLRKALEHIGPIGIKFGQALSTRRDLLPQDIADELGRLQEQAPPFPGQQAREILSEAFGAPPEQLFARFDEQPFAAASVAQVHGAALKDGTEVIVKVLRPGVAQMVERDLSLLRGVAQLLRRLLPAAQRLKPVEVLEEYSEALRRELDLRIEAANTALLRRHFDDSALLYVPQIFWDYTCRNVMVAERIVGLPVSAVDEMRSQGVDFRVLAERGLEIFFIQVFDNNYFHADMHPGNIHVDVSDPDNPSYFALDCAVMGSLSEADLYYLARNLLAIFQRDYRLVAELHIECGWVGPEVTIASLEEAVRTVCEPAFNRPLGEISFGQLLMDLFETARRFDARMQPSLILLQKTLLQVEGLGRQLYPELDFWTTGRPFLKRWLRQRYSPLSMYRRLRNRIPGWLELAPQLPDRLFSALDSLAALETPAARQQPQPATGRRSVQWWWALPLLLGAGVALGYVLRPLL